MSKHCIISSVKCSSSTEVPKRAWLEHVSWIGTLYQKLPLIRKQEKELVNVERLRYDFSAAIRNWWCTVQTCTCCSAQKGSMKILAWRNYKTTVNILSLF